jgi:hypothetical protein
MRICSTVLLFSVVALAQTPATPAGKWISILRFFNDPNYGRLELALTGTRLTGKLANDSFEGTFADGGSKVSSSRTLEQRSS